MNVRQQVHLVFVVAHNLLTCLFLSLSPSSLEKVSKVDVLLFFVLA